MEKVLYLDYNPLLEMNYNHNIYIMSNGEDPSLVESIQKNAANAAKSVGKIGETAVKIAETGAEIAKSGVDIGKNAVDIGKHVTGTASNTFGIASEASKLGITAAEKSNIIAADLLTKSAEVSGQLTGYTTNVTGAITGALSLPAEIFNRRLKLNKEIANIKNTENIKNATIDTLIPIYVKQYNNMIEAIIKELNDKQQRIDDMKKLTCEKKYLYSNCTEPEKNLLNKFKKIKYYINTPYEIKKLTSLNKSFKIKLMSIKDKTILDKTLNDKLLDLDNLNNTYDKNFNNTLDEILKAIDDNENAVPTVAAGGNINKTRRTKRSKKTRRVKRSKKTRRIKRKYQNNS